MVYLGNALRCNLCKHILLQLYPELFCIMISVDVTNTATTYLSRRVWVNSIPVADVCNASTYEDCIHVLNCNKIPNTKNSHTHTINNKTDKTYACYKSALTALLANMRSLHNLLTLHNLTLAQCKKPNSQQHPIHPKIYIYYHW